MEVAAGLGRFAQFIGAALLFGWPLFNRFVGATPPARRLLLAGAALMAVGAGVSLCTQTAAMTGTPSAAFSPADLWLVLTQTTYGHGLAIRFALIAAFAASTVAPAPARLRLLLGGAAVASLALTGHAAAGEGAVGLLHQVADGGHGVAAAVWVGALFALSGRLLGDHGGRTVRDTANALTRFAGLGSLVVAALVATGLVNSWVLVGLEGVPRLAEADYGRLLLAKLALFVLMLALAAANRFVLTPRLAARLDQGRATDGALRALRFSIAAEMGLGLAVLVIVAALGLLPPTAEVTP